MKYAGYVSAIMTGASSNFRRILTASGAAAAILACAWLCLWSCTNSPYRPGEAESRTLFTSFSTPPAKLDPACAAFVGEIDLLGKVCEPPLGYHYLKRPCALEPLTAEAVPEPVCFGRDGRRLEGDDPPAEQVARVEYTIRLKPGIRYQPHPCFARGADGRPLYLDLDEAAAAKLDVASPADFPVQGTRELAAEDYALAVRRLADPRLASPAFATLARSVAGLEALNHEYARLLEAERARRRETGGPSEAESPIRLDYMAPEFPGVQVLDAHTFKIVLTRKYPQIRHWLAKHFFSPVPREALAFYGQPAMVRRQIVLNRWPVGTNAHYLKVFEPNRVIVLERNPNFRDDRYPAEGGADDRANGFLDCAGARLPFVDRIVMRLEKEAIPRWSKFMQGYYDTGGVTADTSSQAVGFGEGGGLELSPEMRARGVTLQTNVLCTVRYFGFNMLDDVVGGDAPAKQKLRRAIAIAIDPDEYLAVFLGNRGVAAQGLLPPGVFGRREGAEGANPYTSVWSPERRRAERRSLDEARRLLAEAGYPGGRGPDGRPLLIHLDHGSAGDPEFVSNIAWYRRRLALVGVELDDRGTESERFRSKLASGNFQTMLLSWWADYPDPENFLCLLYGPNGKARHGGDNYFNYENPEFDRAFEQMEGMRDGPARQALVDRLLEISRRDSPLVCLYHDADYRLYQPWCKAKYSQMNGNTAKYVRIDPELRARLQREWNRPRVWPVMAALAGLLAVCVPAFFLRNRKPQPQERT